MSAANHGRAGRGQMSKRQTPNIGPEPCRGGEMKEAASGMMVPFDALYDQHNKLPYIFNMPRVVSDQKSKFETDELFRRLSREGEVRYTGYRDRPLEERQMRFQNGCREGHTELAFIASGTNLQLMFRPCVNGYNTLDPEAKEVDFDKEQGKVHIKSPFIMNGVCVRWRGWFDLERLDGIGCLEYDEERAQMEDTILREHIERYNARLRDFEEKQRAYRERQAEAEVEVRKKQAALSLMAPSVDEDSNGVTSN